jgi:hypothetical protein
MTSDPHEPRRSHPVPPATPPAVGQPDETEKPAVANTETEPLEPEPVDDPRLQPGRGPDEDQDPGDVQAG